MFDRRSLSEKNGWLDEHGNVYIYFTIDEIQRKMRCSRSKAVKLKKILLKEKLIRYEQKGKTDPHRIYVLPFFDGSINRSVKSDNQISCGINNELREVQISNPNKTENNKTEMNNIYPSADLIDGYDKLAVIDILKRNIEYGVLAEREYDMKQIDCFVGIMADAICSRKTHIRINGCDEPIDLVRGKLFKVTKSHIDYIIDCLDRNTSDVKDIRGYYLTALYNAPSTMEMYYRSRVQHDYPQLAGRHVEGGDAYA